MILPYGILLSRGQQANVNGLVELRNTTSSAFPTSFHASWRVKHDLCGFWLLWSRKTGLGTVALTLQPAPPPDCQSGGSLSALQPISSSSLKHFVQEGRTDMLLPLQHFFQCRLIFQSGHCLGGCPVWRGFRDSFRTHLPVLVDSVSHSPSVSSL